MDRRGGVSIISVEKFLSHISEKLRRGIFQRFINFGNRKRLGIRVGAGGFTFLRRTFLSQGTETFGRATLLCCVPENFR